MEIKNHIFFSPINWDDLINKKITPPFNPNVVRIISNYRMYGECLFPPCLCGVPRSWGELAARLCLGNTAFPSPVAVHARLKIRGGWLFADRQSKFSWGFLASHMLHLHGYFKIIPSIPVLPKGKVRCRKQVASQGQSYIWLVRY